MKRWPSEYVSYLMKSQAVFTCLTQRYRGKQIRMWFWSAVQGQEGGILLVDFFRTILPSCVSICLDSTHVAMKLLTSDPWLPDACATASLLRPHFSVELAPVHFTHPPRAVQVLPYRSHWLTVVVYSRQLFKGTWQLFFFAFCNSLPVSDPQQIRVFKLCLHL